MAKPKIKLDVKGFLLRKGEVLAMGAAGFCLVVLLLWGASKWSSAKDPNEIAKGLADQSNRVTTSIDKGEPKPEDLEAIKPQEFIVKPVINKPATTSAFPWHGPVFDPVAQPSTRRENPVVFNITDYQVDLTRSAMPGYDIIYDGNDEALIAVLATKKVGELDKKKLQDASKQLADMAKRGANRRGPAPKAPPRPAVPPGGMFPGGGEGATYPGGPGNPYGGGGSEYDANSQRVDLGKVIKYIPLKEIDAAVAKGNVPAVTVIPVRLVTVHAVVPYKAQLEEIKRALRLTTDAEAKPWGPWYDGFEVQRRETRRLPSGEVIVEQDWPPAAKDVTSTEGNYKFEDRYIEKIDTRKVGDHFDDGFIPYFLKPEMLLSMPLPLLAKDLNVKYPEIRLKAILEGVQKLRAATTPELTASELAKQLQGVGSKDSIYRPRVNGLGSFGGGEDNLGGVRPIGPGGAGGVSPVGPVVKRAGQPQLPEGYDPNSGVAGPKDTEIENYLLRFVDSDVKPGRTYEYRVRLRMWNPNYGEKEAVANPLFAGDAYRMLYSKWLELPTPISVPAESFLFAYDTQSYREQTAAAYDGQKELLARMQIKDNQAVVQMATWMEQVRTDAGSKREPVGAWVVTEIPVGRGDYIGRRQYVKLPVWSSETQEYLLRETPDKVVTNTRGSSKTVQQPKGWLVDFSTRSILADFEGGKVKSKFSVGFDDKGNLVTKTRQFEEDAATELLILRPDGKLIVRSSLEDEGDPNRKEVASRWSEWLKLVENRKAPDAAGGTGEFNPFDPKKP